MMLLLFVILLTTFLFSSFTVSFRLQTINRVVIYTPVEIFENSISLLDVEDEDDMYFNRVKLYDGLKTYYDANLKKVFKNYNFALYYFSGDNKALCVSDRCKGVSVTVYGNYIFNFNYVRTIKYQIKEGSLHE